MKIIILAIMLTISMQNEFILYDFNSPESSGKWYIVNDGVMGGLSESNMELSSNGTATFTGNVSLENNGGFASIRSVVNLSDKENFKGVALRVMGDGNYYNLRFRNNNNFDGYAYQSKIETEKGVWKEYKIPFDDFTPTFRGYILHNKPALESKNIVQIGILIADKQSGNFELTIDWIKLYR